jgi:hypothetical protein
VLARFSIRQVESARDTALERAENAHKAGDKRSEGIFLKVAQEASQELEARLLTIATSDVMRESQESDRQATELLRQMAG